MLDKLKTFFSIKYFSLWFMLWSTKKYAQWMIELPYRPLPFVLHFDVEGDGHSELLCRKARTDLAPNVVPFVRTGEFGTEIEYEFVYLTKAEIEGQEWSKWKREGFAFFLSAWQHRFGFQSVAFEDGRYLLFPTKSLKFSFESYLEDGMSVELYHSLQSRLTETHKRIHGKTA